LVNQEYTVIKVVKILKQLINKKNHLHPLGQGMMLNER